MPISSRSRRAAARRRRALTAFTVIALTMAAIAAVVVRHLPADDSAKAKVEATPDFAWNEVDIAAAGGALLPPTSLTRPVYLHSVVAGGAYTPAELRTAIGGDPVVTAHYRGLDQSRLRTEVVTQDRYVHVSYRKGDQIFWTKNKVLLRQGETIITDGTTQVRARCGNCISEEPLLPTSEAEPEVVEFDRLVDTPDPPPVAGSRVPAIPQAAPAPVDPFVAGVAGPEGVASPEGGPISPLAAGRLGSGAAPPLAMATGGVPGPPSDAPPPGTLGPPSPPGPPGTDPPPFTPFPELPPPSGDNPPPLVPPEDFPPTDLPPDLPPPYVPPGDPVPVPEPGTLLLVGGGALLARRLLKGRW